MRDTFDPRNWDKLERRQHPEDKTQNTEVIVPREPRAPTQEELEHALKHH